MKNLILVLLFLGAGLFSNHSFASPDETFNGTVNLVSFDSGTIIVTDSFTGVNKAFVVDDKNLLQGIKVGNKVSVTPQENSMNKASKVEKI